MSVDGVHSNGTDTIVLIHGLWLTGLSWERWIRRYQARGRNAEVLHDQHEGHGVDDRHGAPGDDLRHDVTVLSGLGTYQLIGIGVPGVDACHDPAARPVGQPREQECSED